VLVLPGGHRCGTPAGARAGPARRLPGRPRAEP